MIPSFLQRHIVSPLPHLLRITRRPSHMETDPQTHSLESNYVLQKGNGIQTENKNNIQEGGTHVGLILPLIMQLMRHYSEDQ